MWVFDSVGLDIRVAEQTSISLAIIAQFAG
jgi:hypothetical protein